MGGAKLDPAGRYRYQLWRTWEPKGPVVGFVGLNPSTADATTDDPTLRRLMGFARGWGYGGLVLVNLYALRATDPTELWRADDPVGPQTDEMLRRAFERVEEIVLCWGKPGSKGDRAAQVLGWLNDLDVPLRCLGCNMDGSPKHPLYLRKDTQRIPYPPCL